MEVKKFLKEHPSLTNMGITFISGMELTGGVILLDNNLKLFPKDIEPAVNISMIHETQIDKQKVEETINKWKYRTCKHNPEGDYICGDCMEELNEELGL